ncbi:MAG: hypothetical protein HFJ72_00635, partial [Adlercreutzia sp.]|nr:hypothetical protein [Adlercreutzia sp.]
VTGDEVAKNDDVDFIACSVSSETDRNTYQPTLAEGDEKARIDQKVQDSADRIAALAAQMADSGEGSSEGDSAADSEGTSE